MEFKLLELIAKGGAGFPYILLALAVWWIYKQHEQLAKLWTDRLSDIRQITESVDATAATYQAMATATENRTRATDAVAAAQKATADALERNAEVVKDLNNRVDELDKAVLSLRHHIESIRDAMSRMASRLEYDQVRRLQQDREADK